MRRIGHLFVCAALLVVSFAQAVRADDTDAGPAPYAKFIVGAQSQAGLFTVWRKSGKVYIELSNTQLGKDFVQSASPANGLGGWALVWGEDMFAQTRLIQFTRADNKIVITWPNTFFKAPPGSPRERSVAKSFSPSVVALAPIVAEDTAAGKIVFDASALPRRRPQHDGRAQGRVEHDRPEPDLQARQRPQLLRPDEGLSRKRDDRSRRDVLG